MIDPNLLRSNLDLVAKKLARRKFILNINEFRQQESLRKILQKKTESLQTERKAKAKIIGIAKSRGENVEFLCQEAYVLGKKLISLKLENKALKNRIKQFELSLPNIPDDQVPDGFRDQDNLEIMRWGKPGQYNFPIRDHVALGAFTNGLDFANATKLTGSRFIVMKGQIAHLHRALSQFMIDLHVKRHGYEEYYLPYLVNQESLYGAGQLPKFYEDLFHMQHLQSGTNPYTLIPTAEVPLINLVRDVILDEEELPIKMVAHTPCFRYEAGSYGHHTRGLIRMHQFDKVEMVQVVHPDKSMQILEEITSHAEQVLQLLKLPYRKILLCTGNIGFSSCKTYDLEVWLPAYNAYCEVSSCSNVGDFQARRIRARYKGRMHRKTRLLHTLNASGVAIGRALAAVLENYQLEDGRVAIPSVLYPYMNDVTHIN
ncbi:serine--tRNA ligase [Blochmannia endosymbiont of Camponotus sp.]|uniref:serine--tRNA ligase n=1 Tax=Blochmannia endosymbiont of Camponotus sp. TaxID=700220 RepID=UPI002024DFFC|nr:serine--tRNA ligase [Blochmannia endosymbiont of Camponotus sp.]URJ32514.1 serine--tRNA ligase [Blochmannia endosymbiont of Camponotus sp.]